MENDRSREAAKTSLNVCLAGIAGTIPTLALILSLHISPAVKFLFLPLPEVAYLVLWLFVFGAMLATISLRGGLAWLASVAYLLWSLGTFWLTISLGYAIVPENKVLPLITVPIIVFWLIIYVLFRKAYRDTTKLVQDTQNLQAMNEKALQMLGALQTLLNRAEEQHSSRVRKDPANTDDNQGRP